VFKIPRCFKSIIEYGGKPSVRVELMEKIRKETDTVMKLKYPNILRLRFIT